MYLLSLCWERTIQLYYLAIYFQIFFHEIMYGCSKSNLTSLASSLPFFSNSILRFGGITITLYPIFVKWSTFVVRCPSKVPFWVKLFALGKKRQYHECCWLNSGGFSMVEPFLSLDKKSCGILQACNLWLQQKIISLISLW